jgi:hypothetical protein
MRRFSHLCAAASLLAAAACADPVSNPAAPTVGALSATAAAKPGGSVPHTLDLTGYLGGSGPVTGTITGSYSSGNLKASASGSYTLTVTTVDPGNPVFCTTQDLDIVRAALGSATNLVESTNGTASVSVAQNSAADGRASLFWELTNITGSDNRIWEIRGNSTTNHAAFISPGSDTTDLSVSQTDGVIGFGRFAAGGRKKDFNFGCRANFTLRLAQQ